MIYNAIFMDWISTRLALPSPAGFAYFILISFLHVIAAAIIYVIIFKHKDIDNYFWNIILKSLCVFKIDEN